jgi:hypothetical protein
VCIYFCTSWHLSPLSMIAKHGLANWPSAPAAADLWVKNVITEARKPWKLGWTPTAIIISCLWLSPYAKKGMSSSNHNCTLLCNAHISCSADPMLALLLWEGVESLGMYFKCPMPEQGLWLGIPPEWWLLKDFLKAKLTILPSLSSSCHPRPQIYP